MSILIQHSPAAGHYYSALASTPPRKPGRSGKRWAFPKGRPASRITPPALPFPAAGPDESSIDDARESVADAFDRYRRVAKRYDTITVTAADDDALADSLAAIDDAMLAFGEAAGLYREDDPRHVPGHDLRVRLGGWIVDFSGDTSVFFRLGGV